ncbi:MAG: mercuric transport protein MerTP [Chlorobi bacterium]|nr:mercuric transport protein MerTP [Chlorobiota bacterium]
MKKDNKFLWTGVFTAIGASLCCITPVLALISGASGIASAFSWLEPLRPYLIGITVLVLGFAWYQKLKPKKQDDIECACEEEEKPNFWQSKKFLVIVTVFAALMTAFPYYSQIFYPKSEKEIVVADKSDIKKAEFVISGMTCESCNIHVNNEVYKLNGIINSNASYENGNALIEFDKIKTTVSEIKNVINSAGYSVTNIKTK